jgi:starch synthase
MADKRKGKAAKPLDIVFVSSEARPWVKTGGLGDVAGALPEALAAQGNRVRLFLPLYQSVNRALRRIPTDGVRIKVPVSARIMEGRASSVDMGGGLEVWFIAQEGYFGGRGAYVDPAGIEYPDNLERFSFFCRAVLEALIIQGEAPDIIHVNDWQTALIPAYLKTTHAGAPVFKRAKSVLTIHNLGYQGLYHPSLWHLLGLSWDLFNPRWMEFYGKINLLKAGLSFADVITTVSPTYAKEIVAPEGGFGLDGVLRHRRRSLSGVLNGIDADEWNPAADQRLAAKYDHRSLEGKEICKKALAAEFKLDEGDGPLLAVVSRLADGKGMEILLDCLEPLLDLGARFVLLGSGEKWLERRFLEIAAAWRGSMAVTIGFDEALSHRIQAGADMLLVPSRYEPCGLTQMYSLAYGTIPVVRAAGGLNDTIHQYDPATGKGNGFKFEEYSSEALLSKTLEAMKIYSGERGKWNKMVRSGMREDNSWGRSAKTYLKLYRQALASGDL